MANTHARNTYHYQNLARQYQKKLTTVTIHTIIIPSAGPIPLHTYTSLVEVGFQARKVPNVLREMSRASIMSNYRLRFTL